MITIDDKTVLQYLNNFNNDTSFRKLKEKYSSPSFFEIVDVSRDETRHSAFLKWLLQGSEIISNNQFVPLMGLLDALIERDGQRNGQMVIDTKVKNAIASRAITISNIKAKCEQSVGKLGVVEGSKDRIDIYIVCDVEGIDGIEQFEIIIENKVRSKEGKLKDIETKSKDGLTKLQVCYNESSQTGRYFIGTDYKRDRIPNEIKEEEQKRGKIDTIKWIKDTNKLAQFYVFLSPISSYKLKNYSDIDISETCECKNFIHINYQDIVNHIIDPLYDSKNQSAKVQVLLEQYLNNLSMPYIEEDNDEDKNISSYKIIMATQRSDKELIKSFWEKYQNLIKYSISLYENIELSDIPTRQELFESTIVDLINNYGSNKYDSAFGEGIIRNKEKKTHKELVEKLWVLNVMATTTPNTKLSPCSGVSKTFQEIISSKDCYADLVLLYNFYKKNQSIILSALNILSNEGENKDIRDLYEELTDNETPKYVIEYESKRLNDTDDKGNIIGMNLHQVVIKFVETLAKEESKETIQKFFTTEIKEGFAHNDLNSVKDKDKIRFDIYIEDGTSNISYKCRSDKFTGNEDDIYIIVSNQWGSLENRNGTFDKFLKKVEEKYNNFKITELSEYLKNQQESQPKPQNSETT